MLSFVFEDLSPSHNRAEAYTVALYLFFFSFIEGKFCTY